jgi:adenylate cyclase
LEVAEIELTEVDEYFVKPDWLGEEVSDDPRYYNVRLVECPYSTWA